MMLEAATLVASLPRCLVASAAADGTSTATAVFVWLLGLCVGSFLNVVVYRLPRDLSVRRPARSFCPQCQATIAWYDNIPVLSWLILRARCRHCGGAISVQYPLVEAITGLTFVVVYYLLFVAGARAGLPPLQLARDWPLLLSWLVLVAALIACAAMDVTSYMVDVRVTCVTIAAGVLLHAVWPRGELGEGHAVELAMAVAVLTFVVSLIMLWLTVWRVPDAPDEPPEPHAGASEVEAPTPQHAAGIGRLAIAVLVVLTCWLLAETALHQFGSRRADSRPRPHYVENHEAVGQAGAAGLAPQLVVPAALLAVFVTLVLAGGQPRAADLQVSAAIEEEQVHARRAVLRELLWLAPPLVAGTIACVALLGIPALSAVWSAATGWCWGGVCPLGGAAWAMLGAVIGAAAGWTLRIVFTLIFGREAMGVGDIYILAAAGAAAGWDIALSGLLLAVGFAVVGYAVSLLLKKTVVIPFGPWLAIGFVAALWLNPPVTRLAREYYDNVILAWSERPDICLVAGGLLLVGSALAIVLARLTRQAVERSQP